MKRTFITWFGLSLAASTTIMAMAGIAKSPDSYLAVIVGGVLTAVGMHKWTRCNGVKDISLRK